MKPKIVRLSLKKSQPQGAWVCCTLRLVKLAELSDFAECGVCGTAAVVCPVGKVVGHGREICFPSGMESMGPVIQKLYDTLTGIQMGKIEGPAGWVHKIM